MRHIGARPSFSAQKSDSAVLFCLAFLLSKFGFSFTWGELLPAIQGQAAVSSGAMPGWSFRLGLLNAVRVKLGQS